MYTATFCILCFFFFALLSLQTHVTAIIGKPAILVQPQDTVVIGFSFTLMCITDKNNSVRWYHNGKEIRFDRRTDMQKTAYGSLYVSNAVLHRHQGTYQCLVSNPRGAIFSRRAKVTFPYLKQFATGNSIIAKVESHKVVLRCQAPASFPKRQIHWTKLDPQNQGQRKPLPQSHYYTFSADGDLHFSYVKSGDSGDYICTVTNDVINKNVIRTVVLNVMPAVRPLAPQPPMISPEFSAPKIALKGERFVLECIVYGMPVPKITIRMKGIHMILGQITGNARRYFIKSFSSNDAGKYKCKATDPSGRPDARSTTVTMQAKPEWIIKPHDTIEGLNSNTTLSCKAYGIPRVHYQWYFNGAALKLSNKYLLNGGNLTLSNLNYHDGGMYQCVVTNRHGQLVTSAELTVAETAAGFGPGSRAPEPILNKLVHTTIILTCNPSGNPKPTVKWRKGSTYLRMDPRYRFLANGNLQIINVTKLDGGIYTCEVSNRLGSDSRTGRLNVQENLAITSPPKDKLATLGSDVRFRCGVTTLGATEVTIQWSRYYLLLTRSARITIGKIGRDIGYLNIKNVQFGDAGLYECKVTAPIGSKVKPSSTSSTAFSFLKVQGPPEPPTNVVIQRSQQSGYHINITWLLGRDNHNPITHVLIQQNVDFEPMTWTLVKTIANPRQTQAEILLSPWTQYTFRMIAVNAVGQSKPSAVSSSVVTPSNVPEKVPRKIRSKGKSPTTIVISWKPLSAIQQNGPGIYYIVYFKIADSKDKMTRHELRSNKTRFTVGGTDFFVKYAFQVQAANNRGFGPKSQVHYGYSGERYPIVRPTNVKVQITSSTSAYITWTAIPISRKLAGGRLLGYKVYYWTEAKGYRPLKAPYKSSIRPTAMLELDAFTRYRFQVVAYNSRGDSPGSDVFGPITTPMDIPESPTHLTLNVQNSSYVVLQWGRPQKTNGILTSYIISVRRLVDSKTVSGSTNISTSLRVHNLDLQTRYQFSVRAVNSIGDGPPVMADFDLATIPLSWPLRVIASYDEFQREAIIRWKKIKKPMVDGYRIYYWGLDKKVLFVDVERDRTQRTITRLTEGSKYHFQVAGFRLVDGKHYAIGPRSSPVKAGTHKVAARRSNTTPSFHASLLTQLLCVLISMTLYLNS